MQCTVTCWRPHFHFSKSCTQGWDLFITWESYGSSILCFCKSPQQYQAFQFLHVLSNICCFLKDLKNNSHARECNSNPVLLDTVSLLPRETVALCIPEQWTRDAILGIFFAFSVAIIFYLTIGMRVQASSFRF